MTRAARVEILLLLLCWTPAAVAGERQLSPHIVLFHDTVPARPELAARVAARAGVLRVDNVWTEAVRGFSARMTDDAARRLQADPAVAAVLPDLLVTDAASAYVVSCHDALTSADALAVKYQSSYDAVSPQTIDCPQTGPYCYDNWGLDRIDQRSVQRDRRFSFARDGRGVHLYFLDTGINLRHEEFRDAAGRSRIGNGINFAHVDGTNPDPAAVHDVNGHGSHVAAIAAGRRYGVAKAATLHPVRVAGTSETEGDRNTVQNAAARVSWVISGIDWIARNHVKPAVVNMSINLNFEKEPYSTTEAKLRSIELLEQAVKNLVNVHGIAFVNSAGNDDTWASELSPTRLSEVIVVAGSDRQDYAFGRCEEQPSGDCTGTNQGPLVDLFAPAEEIVSAFWAEPNGVCSLSGTSMAAPHVAGAIALHLQGSPGATPAQVVQALTAAATPGAIRSPLWRGTPNRLLFWPF